MDFNQLKDELAKSIRIYDKAEEKYTQTIQAEIDALDKLLTFLMPILPETKINDKRAVLIYVFEESEKKTISPEVYYCEDGKIRYQVYQKEAYRNYNPVVEYEGSYAVVSAEKMFKKAIDLSDVVYFFEERIPALKYIAKEMEEAAEVREDYLANFTKVFKKYL